MILWIAFLVLQLTLVTVALGASFIARAQARRGCYGRAEVASTLSFCLFVLLGVIFICTISSTLTVFSLMLTSVWGFMAWRERRFAAEMELLPA